MAHIVFGERNHGPATPDEWLRATAEATQFAIRISGCSDIAVKLGPGFAAASGTAMFTPSTMEIEVNTTLMLPGVKPEDVRIGDRLFRLRHQTFMGSLVHEAAHRRYSRWMPKDLLDAGFSPQLVDVLVTLEEPRIEYRILRRHPGQREALASTIFDIIGRDFRIHDSAYGAATGAALTLARVDAGVLRLADSARFREVVLETLSSDQLDTLRGLWMEYFNLPFPEDADLPLTAMRSIATRWLEALGLDPDAEGGEIAFKDAEGPADGSEGEGEGQGQGGVSKALSEAARAAAHAKGLADLDKIGNEKAKRRAAQREANIARRKGAKRAADAAFAGPAPKEGGGHGYGDHHGSIVRWRKPLDRERAAGVRLSRDLERVVYTDRRVAKVRQQAPGGRMHGRGQVQRAAQRAAGQQAVADGWVVKRRTHVDTPRLTVGCMVDVSGSMREQALLAGSLAYAVGNAVERVGGDFGMVMFGKQAYGLIKPGQRIDLAPSIEAHDGFENFTQGFHSLDGVLDIVDGEGLRVLVLISDGVFVRPEHQATADAVIPMLAADGVVVLHVDIGNVIGKGHWAHYGPQHHNPYPPVLIPEGTDPVDGAVIIGQKLVELVKAAKKVAA